jgi:hypothetical protein
MSEDTTSDVTELDRRRVKLSWPNLMYYIGTYVEGLRKTIKALLWIVYLRTDT